MFNNLSEMESNNKSVVESKNFNSCFCCVQDGCCRDISSEYYTSGQKEVYEVMIKETFNIQVASEEKNAPRMYICDQCISRLRDAVVFRQMLLDSLEVYREHVDMKMCQNENIEHDSMLVQTSDIKVEGLPLASLDNNDTFNEDSYDDNEYLADLKLELSGDASSKTKSQGRRAKMKKCKIKDDTTEIPRKDTPQKDWAKVLERRGNGPILRDNSLKLLANSTACVFQWNKSRYRCFCCKEPFSDLEMLRDHSTEHTLEEIERKIISQQNRLVKVEISTLNCKICQKNIDNLSTLRTHLTETHKVQFVLSEDLLVPYKINEQLQCQLCFERFSVFRLLNIHMNRHYQKHVCHICGSGFSNSVFLNLHKTRTHRPVNCRVCEVTFSSRAEKKHHDIDMHGVKIERKLRFPCPYCTQRFFQENFRVLHLVEKHGLVKPEHKCDVCFKVFITKSLCNNHIKTVHMKEKNQECDVCHKLFYNKSDVLRHRVTHTGEKKFSCTICSTPFATKDSLRRHLRRTHVGMQ